MGRRKTEQSDHNESYNQIKKDLEEKKRLERKRKRKRRTMKVFRILLLILLIVAWYLFDKSEYSRIKQVKINGTNVVPQQEVAESLGIYEGDRIYTKLAPLLERKGKKIPGVESLDASLYYSKGIVSINVHEVTAVGYQRDPLRVLMSDGTKRDVGDNSSIIVGLPVFEGFSDESLTKELLENFGKVGDATLNAISEVHLQPTKFDETAMMIVLNNEYRAYSGVNTLPLLKDYATIISKADPNNRCLYFSEYGPNDETQTVTTRECD